MIEQTPARRGRKPVADKEAPHGRDPKTGKPLTPHGTLPNGKPRVNPKREITLDAAMLAAPSSELPPAAVKATKRRAPRSEAQRALDKVVADIYAKWVAAGKPKASDWEKLPKAVYRLSDPRQVEQIVFLAKKAATHLRHRLVLGERVRDGEGKTVVVFSVVDMVQKKPASK